MIGRHRTRNLIHVFGIGSLILAVMTLGSERGEAAPIAFQTVGTSDVYARHCAPCHGAAGEGSDFGPALTASELSVEDRIAIITGGSSAMPAFGSTLAEDEIAQLAELADPIFAGGVFVQQCGPCHGSDGGGGVGPSLRTSTMSEADQAAIISQGSEVMPAFEPTLTPAQIDSLIAYLATFVDSDPPPVDGEAIYAVECSGCHGADGALGVGPSLRESTMGLEGQLVIIRDGRGGMPGYGSTLSLQELEAVAAFSASLQNIPADPIERGAGVYADSCSGCHGIEGAGGSGPNLRTTNLSRDELTQAVRQGKGTMPGFASQLRSDDLEAVVTFVETLTAEGDEPDGAGPSLVVRGSELFASNCARCHGPDASGGFGPSLKYSGLTDVEMVSVITNGIGAMPSFGDILTSSDTTALVAYVESARVADGSPDPLTEVAHGREVYVTSCATCHGLDGTGGVGPSLANSRLSANEIISQVYGTHADRMPGFEGVLDAIQVQDVARYVLTIEGESRSQTTWLVLIAVAVIAVAGAVGLWYSGALNRFVRRFRARSASSDG